MASASIIRFLNPRKYRRDREAERVRAIKLRDGDKCARCRRPLRFDLPLTHDLAAIVEPAVANPANLDSHHLCHRRCNPSGVDHTGEVTERVRRKSEAALFSKKRKRRAA